MVNRVNSSNIRSTRNPRSNPTSSAAVVVTGGHTQTTPANAHVFNAQAAATKSAATAARVRMHERVHSGEALYAMSTAAHDYETARIHSATTGCALCRSYLVGTRVGKSTLQVRSAVNFLHVLNVPVQRLRNGQTGADYEAAAIRVLQDALAPTALRALADEIEQAVRKAGDQAAARVQQQPGDDGAQLARRMAEARSKAEIAAMQRYHMLPAPATTGSARH